MKRFSMKAAIAAMTLALAVTAGLATAAEIGSLPGSELELKGKSTMHAYEAKAAKLDATFACDAAALSGALDAEAIEKLIRAKGITSMDMVIPVTALHSGKDGLDKNMYKALLAAKNPNIRFHMVGYEVVDGATPAEMIVKAHGTLTVAGAERELTMSVNARRDADGIRLTSTVPLLMTTFGIKPPTMMMGAIKTSDEVTITFNLLVGAREGSHAAKTE